MANSKLTHRPMKFWGVLSAFRSHDETLSRMFSRTEWRDPYLDWYRRRNELVDDKKREVLDALVPLELTRNIVKQISEPYYLDGTSRNLRADQIGMSESDNVQQMTALEVHDTFGGAFIEEVQEYGSATIPNVV